MSLSIPEKTLFLSTFNIPVGGQLAGANSGILAWAPAPWSKSSETVEKSFCPPPRVWVSKDLVLVKVALSFED